MAEILKQPAELSLPITVCTHTAVLATPLALLEAEKVGDILIIC